MTDALQDAVRRLADRVLVEDNDSGGYTYLRGLVAYRATRDDGFLAREDAANAAAIVSADREVYAAFQAEVYASGASYTCLMDLLLQRLLIIQKAHGSDE